MSSEELYAEAEGPGYGTSQDDANTAAAARKKKTIVGVVVLAIAAIIVVVIASTSANGNEGQAGVTSDIHIPINVTSDIPTTTACTKSPKGNWKFEINGYYYTNTTGRYNWTECQLVCKSMNSSLMVHGLFSEEVITYTCIPSWMGWCRPL